MTARKDSGTAAPRDEWVDDHHCYVCGKDNPEGFRLGFAISGREVETSFVAEKRHQGYRDVLHGGFLAVMMDEVMVQLPYRVLGVFSVTAEVTFRLLKPVPVGKRVRVRAFFPGKADAETKLYRVDAECLLDDGTVVARGTGKCLRIS